MFFYNYCPETGMAAHKACIEKAKNIQGNTFMVVHFYATLFEIFIYDSLLHFIENIYL